MRLSSNKIFYELGISSVSATDVEFGWEFPELGISREIAPFLELGFPGKMFGNFGKFGKFFVVKNAIFTGFKRFKSDAKPNFLKNSYVRDSVISIQTFAIVFLLKIVLNC